jgi:hypothetical protein
MATRDNLNPLRDQAQRTFENVKERVRDATEDLEDMGTEPRRILNDAQQRIGDFYEVSSDWVQQNRLASTLALAAVAGVVGFFIGRGSNNRDMGI